MWDRLLKAESTGRYTTVISLIPITSDENYTHEAFGDQSPKLN